MGRYILLFAIHLRCRLSPPLRLGIESKESLDALGGKSGAIFPFVKPEGYHGFSFPGQEMDIRFKDCLNLCSPDNDDEMNECETMCSDEIKETFDLGNYMSGFLGGYMRTGGKKLDMRPCLSWGCDGVIPPKPTSRDKSDLYGN